MEKLSKLFEGNSLGSQILRYATIFDPASLVQLSKERLQERLQGCDFYKSWYYESTILPSCN